MKKTRKSLLFSGLALMMSALLLAGTTFAWFTDSVTNTGNRIEAGTLQVDLLMDKEGNGTYESIADSKGDIFSEAEGGNGYNWEPGMTQVVYLAVKNNGSLAINYNFVLDVIDGNPGLVGSLKYAVLNGTKASDMDGVDTWEEVVAKANANVPTTGGTGDVVGGQTRFTPGRTLEAGEMATFAMAVHMDEDADNQYQNGSIQIDVNVIAKQAASEADGFGNTDYDANAEWPVIPDVVVDYNSEASEAENGAALQEAINEVRDGGTVLVPAGEFSLSGSIALGDKEVVLQGSEGTVVNCTANESGSITVMGSDGAKLTVRDMTFKGDSNSNGSRGVCFSGQQNANGTVVVENCTFENLNTGIYLGGVTNATITNCTFTNCGAGIGGTDDITGLLFVGGCTFDGNSETIGWAGDGNLIITGCPTCENFMNYHNTPAELVSVKDGEYPSRN